MSLLPRAAIGALALQRFESLNRIQDFGHPQSVIAIQHNDLPLRDDLSAHEEFDRVHDLLIQFNHRSGAELENVAQGHFRLPEPQSHR